MLADRPSARYLLLFSALAAAVSCSDRTQLTNPLGAGDASRAAAAPTNAGKVKVKQLQLASNTLGIEGPAVTGTVIIGNSGAPIDNVTLRGTLVQGAATRLAASAQLTCAGTPGTLPNGTCSMTISVAASNAADGSGTLVAGAALFVLDVVQDVAGTPSVLATKSLDVNLTGAVTISSLTLQSTTLTIDGPSVEWTAILNNPGGTRNDVTLQGEIFQGTAEKGAGGTSVTCGAAIGVLPPGACTVSFTAVASNSTGGIGTLVPGAATFRLQLIETSGGTSTVLDTKSVAITLAAPHVAFTDVTLSSTYVVLDGPSLDFTASAENTTSSTLSNMLVQVNLIQGGVVLATTGAWVNCGAGSGIFPAGASCTVSGSLIISSSILALTTGDATIQVRLVEFASTTTTFDSRTFPVTVVPNTPSIAKLQLQSTTMAIESATNYTVTLYNPTNAALSIVVVQADIIQGAADRAAGGTNVWCDPAGGTMPVGACTFPWHVVISNSNAGSGTLVAGSATLRLRLIHYDVATNTTTTLDEKLVPVTLTSP